MQFQNVQNVMINSRKFITLGIDFTWLDSYKVVSLYLVNVNRLGWLAGAMIINRLIAG